MNAIIETAITVLNSDIRVIPSKTSLPCITAFEMGDKIFKCPTESKEISLNAINNGGNETENHNMTAHNNL